MNQQIVYQLDKKDLADVLQSELSELQKNAVLSRYRDRMISANAVAEIHAVHRSTVIKYAKAKLLPYVRDNKLYKFSLADALQFDFNELRKVS